MGSAAGGQGDDLMQVVMKLVQLNGGPKGPVAKCQQGGLLGKRCWSRTRPFDRLRANGAGRPQGERGDSSRPKSLGMRAHAAAAKPGSVATQHQMKKLV